MQTLFARLDFGFLNMVIRHIQTLAVLDSSRLNSLGDKNLLDLILYGSRFNVINKLIKK